MLNIQNYTYRDVIFIQVSKKGSYLQLQSTRLRHASDNARQRASTSGASDDHPQYESGSGRVRRLSEGSDRERHDSENSMKSASAGSTRSIRSDRSDDNLYTPDSGEYIALQCLI